MPKTPLMLEFQITKEYLGQDTHLVYLGAAVRGSAATPTRTRRARARRSRRSSTGRCTATRAPAWPASSNIGTDRNWTGSQFNQANWYAFGRLAWDPALSSRGDRRRMDAHDVHERPGVRRADVAHDDDVARGGGELHDAARPRAHHGDGTPLRARAVGQRRRRADWTPVYYHRADALGIGFDRTATGSNAVAQYSRPCAIGTRAARRCPTRCCSGSTTCRGTDRMRSGRTLWDELVDALLRRRRFRALDAAHVGRVAERRSTRSDSRR